MQKLDMAEDKYERLIGKQRQEINPKEPMNKSYSKRNKNALMEEEEKDAQVPLNKNDYDSNRGESEYRSKRGVSSFIEEGKKNKNKEHSDLDQEINPIFKDSLFGDYDILSKAQTQMEVSDEKLLTKLSNHIVVCGIHSSIFHFILPLRAKYLKTYMQDIVIISPLKNIPSEIWDSIARFRKIFVITGSPLSREILRKAQIHRADKAVILGYDPTIKHKKNEVDFNDEMMDAQAIFIYKAIRRLNPQLQILIELGFSSNIKFLVGKGLEQPQESYQFSTLFSAGEVYIASIIDTITAQAFYNPHVVTIL
mmetsp:Transcript_35561/g.34594  ORF Transcript_35561/g.34594 Transcript_35561/m.34594 type:complete len:309 (+) Transcript_35561:1861-2787(+)